MDTGNYMANQMDNLITASIMRQEELYEEAKCLIGDDYENSDPNDLYQN